MDDEEKLREYVLKVRTYRQSFQTFKADLEAVESEKVAKIKKTPKKVDLKEFNEFF